MEEKLTDLNQHESIETKVYDLSKTYKIRQERFIPKTENCFLVIRETKYQVTNYNAFGIAIISDTELTEDEIAAAPFIYENFLLGTLHIKVVRKETLSNGKHIFAFEILSQPINTDTVQAIDLAKSVLNKLAEKRESNRDIPEVFRNYVTELKDFLTLFHKECSELENNLNFESSNYLNFKQTLAEILGEKINQIFEAYSERLKDIIKQIPSSNTDACFNYFRKELKNYLYLSPLPHRALRKPLGYAGDYQMMNIIYEQQYPFKDIFSSCMHNFFINLPASKAVRNRAILLKSKIKSLLADRRYLKVLSVACGPAKEIEYLLNELTDAECRKLSITLLDQDNNALQDAQNRIRRIQSVRGISCDVQYLNLAIKNVIEKGIGTSQYDFIYSAGLFDYFSDAIAVISAKKLFRALNEEGQLIIGNFNKGNPTQIFMELISDWNLIYRDEEDLKKLFSRITENLTMEKEDQGINLFCVLRK